MIKLLNILLIIGFSVLLIAFVMSFGLHYARFIAPFRGAAFNQEQWIAAERGKTDIEQLEIDTQCLRGAMVNDLKRNYLKANTTKDEVLALLGKTKFIKYNGDQTCLSYNLGMCSGFKIDYDSLYICFDKNSVFTQAVTVQG